MTSAASGFGARLWRPIDGAWLSAFRTLYGLTMAFGLARFVAYGWLDLFLIEPQFHFKYWGFGWIEPLPPGMLHALALALAGLGLCVAAGAFFRVSACAFVIGFSYLELVDVTTYLNHYYLAALLGGLLALSPAHRNWSVDAWLRARARARGQTRPDTSIAAFWLYLLRFQVGLVYTCAGLAKAQGDWLLHAQPLRIWLGARTELPWVGPILRWDWAAPVMSWLGFAFDLSIALWLSIPKTRPYAFAALVVFHGLTGMLFPIGLFPVIMVTAALVFFSPSWPRQILARCRALFGLVPSTLPLEAEPVPAHRMPGPRARWALLGASLAYCAVHVVLPLRYLAYPGNVLWHEQGMRWSWRVMVREKNGSVSYSVRDRETGHEWQVSPRRYLSRAQEREMSGQPDLILQLAHHIRDDFRARGHANVEVRADALVSLNARPMALLIDPTVDLAQIRDGVSTATWIAPMPAQAPLRLRPL